MLSESILGRAIAAGLLQVRLTDIREFTADRHRRVDDYPFGGGAGMVMAAQPIADAIAARDPGTPRPAHLPLPRAGEKLDQRIVEELAARAAAAAALRPLRGRRPARTSTCASTRNCPIGDYVLTRGELGALVVVDAVARLVPGVLGSAESGEDESFTTGLLEYPQYNPPRRVPRPARAGGAAGRQPRGHRRLAARALPRADLRAAAGPAANRAADGIRPRSARPHGARRPRDRGARRPRRGRAPDGHGRGDAFPKRWFAAFVPEESCKAAKRHCFSGGGTLAGCGRPYSMDFAPHVSGGAARAQLESYAGEVRQIYLCADRVLLETPNGLTPGAAEALGPCLMVGAAQALHLCPGPAAPAPARSFRRRKNRKELRQKRRLRAPRRAPQFSAGRAKDPPVWADFFLPEISSDRTFCEFLRQIHSPPASNGLCAPLPARCRADFQTLLAPWVDFCGARAVQCC